MKSAEIVALDRVGEDFLSRGSADAQCVRDDHSGWLTRAALWDTVQDVAKQLGQRGPGLVFLLASNEIPTVIGLLAAWSLQMPVALLDPNRPVEEFATLIETYKPQVVLEGPGEIMEMVGYEALAPTGAAHAPRIHLARHRSRELIHPELSLLLSTSGSTGSPKFVRLSRRAVVTNARQIAEALSIRESDIGIGHLPLHYSYGLSVLTSHLMAGAAVSLTAARVTDAVLWQRVREDSGTHFPGVPFHYTVLDRLGINRVVPPSVKSFTQAGGHLDVPTRIRCRQAIRQRGGRFYVMYGQTEAGPRMTTLQDEDFPSHSETVGKVLNGGQLVIVDDLGNVQPPGNEGNLVYQGLNVMMGYAVTRVDLGRGNDQGGRLETGDRGVLSTEGFLTLTGRTQRFAKIAGLRIGLDEVERLLGLGSSVAAVAPAERITLYVEKRVAENVATRLPELAQLLRLPNSVFETRLVDTLPIKPSGKIDYKVLVQTQ